MRVRGVLTIAAPLVLCAASAWAASDGSPLATPAQQIVQTLSGPGALIMIACGFIGAGVVYFVSRDLGHAFITLGALVVGGVLCSQIQTFAAYLFPTAVATIEAPAPAVTPAPKI
jgi:type IV secretory pathway VirB2 component (pilin)